MRAKQILIPTPMTQQEIQERNRQIVLMLGLNHDDESVVFKMQGYSWDNLKFDSDWNWLMEALIFIKSQTLIESSFTIELYNDKAYITYGYIDDPQIIIKSDPKEAIFIAASDFAKLYNEK